MDEGGVVDPSKFKSSSIHCVYGDLHTEGPGSTGLLTCLHSDCASVVSLLTACCFKSDVCSEQGYNKLFFVLKRMTCSDCCTQTWM